MLDWLYKKLAKALVNEFEVWIQEPSHIEQITKLADAIFDREMKRLIGSVAGAQKDGADTQQGLQSLLSGKGGISSKKLIGLGLQWWLDKQKQDKTKLQTLP